MVELSEAMANYAWPGLNAAELFVVKLANQIYAAAFALEAYRLQRLQSVLMWSYSFSCEAIKANVDCFNPASITGGIQTKATNAVKTGFAALTDKSKMLSGKADPKRPETV